MIFANWKENGSISMINDWAYDFLEETDDDLFNNINIGIAPSYIHFQLFKDLLEQSKVMIGAQDVDYGNNARTSKISAIMLKDFNIDLRCLNHNSNFIFSARWSNQYSANRNIGFDTFNKLLNLPVIYKIFIINI